MECLCFLCLKASDQLARYYDNFTLRLDGMQVIVAKPRYAVYYGASYFNLWSVLFHHLEQPIYIGCLVSLFRTTYNLGQPIGCPILLYGTTYNYGAFFEFA